MPNTRNSYPKRAYRRKRREDVRARDAFLSHKNSTTPDSPIKKRRTEKYIWCVELGTLEPKKSTSDRRAERRVTLSTMRMGVTRATGKSSIFGGLFIES